MHRGLLAAGLVVLLLVGIVAAILVYQSAVPERRTALPATVADYAAACGGRRVAFTAAASHTGPAPHPMVIFEYGNQFTYSDLPGELQANDPARVQLIACGQQQDYNDSAPVVETCHYVPGGQLITVPSVPGSTPLDLPMRQGKEDFSVYEAKTGKLVAHIQVAGTGTTCPDQVAARAGDTPKIQSQLTLDDYVKALRPLAG